MATANGSAFVPSSRLASDARRARPLPCLDCPVKAYNVCKPLEYERQKQLFELGVQQSWKRRQFLYRAGDPATTLFKITSGIVAVSRPFADGRRQILGFFLAGEICGFIVKDGKYAFDGEAITEVGTCSLNRRRFDAFAAQHRDVADEIRTALTEKLRQTSEHMAAIGQLSSAESVADFLCRLGSAYSEHAFQTRPLLLPMTRHDIAEYLGLRLETVSRAFSKLKKRGILDLDEDKILIHDPARLARLSGA